MSYIRLDNNFTDPDYGSSAACFGARGARELNALRVTAAHESFHAIQFSYYHGSDGSWWEEASATWMEEVAFTEVDDYLQYLCDFILAPARALNSAPGFGNRVYGATVFAHFLSTNATSVISFVGSGKSWAAETVPVWSTSTE